MTGCVYVNGVYSSYKLNEQRLWCFGDFQHDQISPYFNCSIFILSLKICFFWCDKSIFVIFVFEILKYVSCWPRYCETPYFRITLELFVKDQRNLAKIVFSLFVRSELIKCRGKKMRKMCKFSEFINKESSENNIPFSNQHNTITDSGNDAVFWYFSQEAVFLILIRNFLGKRCNASRM